MTSPQRGLHPASGDDRGQAQTSFRGGASVGWVHASWPLAQLVIGRNRIVLTGIGHYEFTPDEIVEIRPYGSIPILNWGLKIVHNRLDCPEQIVFRTLGNRQRLSDAIEQSGFVPNGLPTTRPRGFPVRWSVIICVLAIWTAIFWLGEIHIPPNEFHIGRLGLVGLLLVFCFFVSAKFSKSVQQLVLAEGHNIGEVWQELSMMQIGSGVILLAFSALYFFGE